MSLRSNKSYCHSVTHSFSCVASRVPTSDRGRVAHRTVNRSRRRTEHGNMLLLSGVFMASAAVAIILAMSFAGLLFAFNRLQTTADELAIAGARKLNELDRIGQMNNMIARSRQQVYACRQQLEVAQTHHPQLVDLTHRLLEEARDGAAELEHQRTHLRGVNSSEVQAAVMEKFNQIKGRHALVLPWINAGIPETPQIKLGYIDQVQSNVTVLENLDELHNADIGPSVSDSQSDLYKENIDARLAGSDGDLSFKMSSLPAPVLETVAPARETLANSFRTSPGDHLQSAVQVEIVLKVDTMIGASGSGKFHSIGTALATGASKMR